eukprot:5077384-Prymnesium_polylepis.1
MGLGGGAGAPVGAGSRAPQADARAAAPGASGSCCSLSGLMARQILALSRHELDAACACRSGATALCCHRDEVARCVDEARVRFSGGKATRQKQQPWIAAA